MTDEQKAAFIQSQVACATIEAMGMVAENTDRQSRGFSIAYDEVAFDNLTRKYIISHNAVIEFMRD